MFSLGITTHERVVEVIRLFSAVYHCPEIKEIVIIDDDSNDYERLQGHAHFKKIKLFKNEKNLGCFLNKMEVIKKCTQSHVLLIDSDNQIDDEYVKKAIDNIDGKTIIAPSRALPNFDYRSIIGTLDKSVLPDIRNNSTLETSLNTNNWVVPREEFLDFLSTLDTSFDCQGLDSMYVAVEWLKSGRKIKVVDGLEYQHEIRHHDSVYLKTQNPESIKEQILKGL